MLALKDVPDKDIENVEGEILKILKLYILLIQILFWNILCLSTEHHHCHLNIRPVIL
jgi:hypothetical protein